MKGLLPLAAVLAGLVVVATQLGTKPSAPPGGGGTVDFTGSFDVTITA